MTTAIVRGVPDSFGRAEQRVRVPIDVARARAEHDAYVAALRANVVALPADEAHPDSCFVEDTCVVVGRRAAVTRLGAPSRRGEERAVRDALVALGVDAANVEAPATIDGGDVLWTGRELLVGRSSRTNEDGANAVSAILDVPVRMIPVANALHLKSIATRLGTNTLVVADDALDGLGYELVRVPDPIASNVVVAGGVVLIQAGFPRSEAILRDAARRFDLDVVALDMSELAKADAALTCCSVLVD
ncbi:MAG TPA: arginine deiminase-related protein [Labilithrix sp.]